MADCPYPVFLYIFLVQTPSHCNYFVLFITQLIVYTTGHLAKRALTELLSQHHAAAR